MNAEMVGNNYFSNGLIINSQISFPELQVVSQSDFDVIIRYGSAPDSLSGSHYKTNLGEISNGEFLLNIPDVGKYWVRNGSEVIVDVYPESDPDAVRMYVLSSVFGVLSYMNGFLPLHAASIKTENGAVLMAGRSGIGKSSLALGLYKKGFEVLNDDISSVSFSVGPSPNVFPGYVHLKLWGNSLEWYGYNANVFRKLRNNYEKYSYPIERMHGTNPIPLKALIFITADETLKEPECKIVSGLTAFEFLRKNTFRYPFVKELDKLDTHFSHCGHLLNTTPMFSIIKPVDISLQYFADYVENILNNLG